QVDEGEAPDVEQAERPRPGPGDLECERDESHAHRQRKRREARVPAGDPEPDERRTDQEPGGGHRTPRAPSTANRASRRTACAGSPTDVAPPGRDRMVTQPVPSTVQSPRHLPGMRTLRVHSSQPTPIVTLPDRCTSGCSVANAPPTSSCATWQCMFTVTNGPIRTFTVTIAPAAT